jgi:hypothetical protein
VCRGCGWAGGRLGVAGCVCGCVCECVHRHGWYSCGQLSFVITDPVGDAHMDNDVEGDDPELAQEVEPQDDALVSAADATEAPIEDLAPIGEMPVHQMKPQVPLPMTSALQTKAGKTLDAAAKAVAAAAAVPGESDAGSASEPNSDSVVNSRSHPAKYRQFFRQCQNRKVFPTTMASEFSKSPTNLFKIWLENNGDWSQVQMHHPPRSGLPVLCMHHCRHGAACDLCVASMCRPDGISTVPQESHD